MLVVVRRKNTIMSTENDTLATDYYNYADANRNVEHDVPVRPIGDLFNTIQLDEEQDSGLV